MQTASVSSENNEVVEVISPAPEPAPPPHEAEPLSKFSDGTPPPAPDSSGRISNDSVDAVRMEDPQSPPESKAPLSPGADMDKNSGAGTNSSSVHNDQSSNLCRKDSVESAEPVVLGILDYELRENHYEYDEKESAADNNDISKGSSQSAPAEQLHLGDMKEKKHSLRLLDEIESALNTPPPASPLRISPLAESADSELRTFDSSDDNNKSGAVSSKTSGHEI